MNEHIVKEMCKFVVDHGRNHYSTIQKWMIKQAIDSARNWEELFAIAVFIG